MYSLKLSISKVFLGLSALITCSSGFTADQGPVKFTPGSISIAKPQAVVRPVAAVRPVAIKPAAHSASPKLSTPGSMSSAFSPAAASSSSSSSQSSVASASSAAPTPAIISSSNFVNIEGSFEEFKNSLENN